MLTVTARGELRGVLGGWKKDGLTVGLVPTMGYLHEGHLALARRARAENDRVVMTIFVNPLQFAPHEDFERYPRDLERDSALARSAGVDLLFVPDAGELYPPGFNTHVEVRGITQYLCGRSRPQFFGGVATVVCKLFNLVRPHRAYFGQKDGQQVLVVKRMVADLDMDMDIEIVTVPTVRDEDGLALSSRNDYLNPAERAAALVVPRSLQVARRLIEDGERDARVLRRRIRQTIEAEPLARVDYVSVNDGVTLAEVDEVGDQVMLAVAVHVGAARLIDNIVLRKETGRWMPATL